MQHLAIMNDPEGRAWLSTVAPIPAWADGDGESGTDGGDAGGSDDGGGSGDAGSDDAGETPAASGKKGGKQGKDGKGDDPIGQALRTENAGLRKNLKARTEELQRSRKKYDTAVTAIGGETELDEFRNWKSNQAKVEDDKLRKEGEWDKLEAQLRGQLSTSEQENVNLKLGIIRREINQELTFAAGPAETDAVNPSQIVALYGDQMTMDLEEGSATYGKYVHRSEFNDQGHRMNAAEFLEQERSGAGANLFNSTLKPGSGAGDGGSVESGTVTVKMVGGALSPEEQAKYDKASEDGRAVKFVHIEAA